MIVKNRFILEPQREHRYWLKYFWDNFGGNKCLILNKTEKEKLDLLKMMSGITIKYKNTKELTVKRNNFDKIKYSRHNFNSHKKCFVCLNNATVRHHIILLKNGGINCKRNIISLCEICHKKIHNWI